MSKISSMYNTEEYYKKFIELQDKLRKSEEERLKLEIKFNEMMQVAREEEQLHYRKLRSQYKHFLEEDKKRQERNERLLRTLERIECRAAMLAAKTERFKLLRKQYHAYLKRTNIKEKITIPEKEPPKPTINPQNLYEHPVIRKALDKTQENKNDLLDKYFESMPRNENKTESGKPNARLPFTYSSQMKKYDNLDSEQSFLPSSLTHDATSVADEIYNSIARKSITKSKYGDYNNESSNDDGESVKNCKFSNDFWQNKSKIAGNNKYKVSFEDEKRDYRKEELDLKSDIDDHTRSSSPNSVISSIPSVKIESEMQNLTEKPALINMAENLSPKEIIETVPNELRHADECSEKSKRSDDTNDEHVYEDRKIIEDPKLGLNIQNLEGKQFENKLDMQTQRPNIEKVATEDKNSAKNQNASEFSGGSNGNIQSNEPVLKEVTQPNDTDKKSAKDAEDIQDSNTFEILQEPNVIQNSSKSEKNASFSNDRFERKIEDSQLQEKEIEPESDEIKNIEENKETTVPINEHNDVDQLKSNVEANSEQNETTQFTENDQPIQSYDTADNQLHQNDKIDQLIQQYNADDQPTQQLDENGQSIQQYHEDDQPTQQFDENGQPIQQYVDHSQYDENGQIIQYDENGQPIHQQYDENGQPILQYDEHGQPIQQYDTQLLQQYDENGQPIQQYNDHNQPLQQYDENGQLVQQYDENGQPIQQYDEHGQPIQQYDEHGQLFQQYDEHGQPLQQYDEHGQPIQQYDENGQPILQYQDHQYDENGQLIQQYDEHGQPIQQYDENGQLIQQYSDHDQLYQQYDENGQPIQQYDVSDQPLQQFEYKAETDQPLEQHHENQEPLQQTIENETKSVVENLQSSNNVDESDNKSDNLSKDDVNKSDLKNDSGDVKNPNVMEMLDTDTESTKQDTKISNDSDFDFSNN